MKKKLSFVFPSQTRFFCFDITDTFHLKIHLQISSIYLIVYLLNFHMTCVSISFGKCKIELSQEKKHFFSPRSTIYPRHWLKVKISEECRVCVSRLYTVSFKQSDSFFVPWFGSECWDRMIFRISTNRPLTTWWKDIRFLYVRIINIQTFSLEMTWPWHDTEVPPYYRAFTMLKRLISFVFRN